jgi:hypothetical protein
MRTDVRSMVQAATIAANVPARMARDPASHVPAPVRGVSCDCERRPQEFEGRLKEFEAALIAPLGHV